MSNTLRKHRLVIILAILCFAFPTSLWAGGSSEGGEFDPVPMIMHHLADSHDWHVLDLEGENGEMHAVSVPLPVILYSAEGGFDMFLSSAFHHDDNGEHVANGEYVKYHEKIYYAPDGELQFEGEGDERHPSNAMPLDFSITKNVASMFLSIFLLIILFRAVAKNYSNGNLAPKGLAGFLEPLVLFVRDDIAYENIQRDKADKFLPYLLTVFFFIWINNLLGLVPFFPGGANMTGNIAVTLVLAVFTLILTNINGTKAYWGHILAPPVPVAMWPIMIPVELIGIVTKPFALMIRLFANITAGHALILSLVSIIFIMKSVAMSGVAVPFMVFMMALELLVAALQAYIFTLLSALFIGMAVEDAHH